MSGRTEILLQLECAGASQQLERMLRISFSRSVTLISHRGEGVFPSRQDLSVVPPAGLVGSKAGQGTSAIPVFLHMGIRQSCTS